MSVTTKSSISTAVVSALKRAERPVDPPVRPERAESRDRRAEMKPAQPTSTVPDALPSQDSRYVRFVEAVRGLRLEAATMPPPSPEDQRALAAAREIFQMDDGVPKEVRPSTGSARQT